MKPPRRQQRKDLCLAVSALTGYRDTVVQRVIDGLVAEIIARTLAGEETQILRLGRFRPEVWHGRPKWVPHGPQGTGSVRVLQDRVKLAFTAAERTANSLRDSGPPPKRLAVDS